MYTVVVADDEEEIRKLLIQKVDWESIGFQVVGEAENGVEALEQVEKYEPDLLVTDIKMPFISGIELARQVREIRPAIQIAFLSGYDDFSYAQQAIHYNIISYMLKPISAKKMTEELISIRNKIEEKFDYFSAQIRVPGKMEKSEFLLQLFLDSYQEDTAPNRESFLRENAAACGVISRENANIMHYVVIVINMVDEQGKNVTSRTSVNAIDSILEKYVKHSSVYIQGRVASLLMATNMGFEKYMHILVEDIVQSVKRILGWDCFIGVSRIGDFLSGCHERYLEAMNALSYSEGKESNVHFIADEERMAELDLEMVQKKVVDIENLIRGGTEEEIIDCLREIPEKQEKGELNRNIASFILMQLATVALQTVYMTAGHEAVQKLQQKLPVHHSVPGENFRQVFQQYVDICVSARNMIEEERRCSGNVICEQAIRIIQKEYADPMLSLTSVSSMIAVSPNYLSTLIKKNTGSTFKDLLTEQRIESAKDMLLRTSMKIREIAEKCGYSDQHYFSYCFKKYVGISPNECRRIYEEGKKV